MSGHHLITSKMQIWLAVRFVEEEFEEMHSFSSADSAKAWVDQIRSPNDIFFLCSSVIDHPDVTGQVMQ